MDTNDNITSLAEVKTMKLEVKYDANYCSKKFKMSFKAILASVL